MQVQELRSASRDRERKRRSGRQRTFSSSRKKDRKCDAEGRHRAKKKISTDSRETEEETNIPKKRQRSPRYEAGELKQTGEKPTERAGKEQTPLIQRGKGALEKVSKKKRKAGAEGNQKKLIAKRKKKKFIKKHRPGRKFRQMSFMPIG